MNTIFIDESGNLGKSGNYMIFALCIMDKKNQRKWKNIAKKYLKKHSLSEIKASNLKYKQKIFLVKKINKNLKLKLYLGIIKKNTPFYKNKWIVKNPNKKELVVNYLLGRVLKQVLDKDKMIFVDKKIEIVMDERNIAIKGNKSLEDYLNTELLNITDYVISLEYTDSRNHYCVQLSDLIANIVWANKEHKKNKFLNNLIKKFVSGSWEYSDPLLK